MIMLDDYNTYHFENSKKIVLSWNNKCNTVTENNYEITV